MTIRSGQRINCRRCRHFYITWDERFPYGCRIMGFKSKVLPCQDVFAATRQPCLSFEVKQVKERPNPSWRDDMSI